jgi:uncharacterized damage-inducible protein DinB
MDGMSYRDYANQLRASQAFFERTLSCMREEDGTYQPHETAFSTIAQVAHAAQTVDWFMEGVREGGSFSVDFEAMEKELAETKTLRAAKAWFHRSMALAIQAAEEKPESFWKSHLPEGPMFSGEPRSFALGGILDHNAHHRGAISVYARLCGHKPAMPYMED